MVTSPPFMRLNRLRIAGSGSVAYDETFHEGVNIIRGQNGSGKSTIADFIFFVLGGEFGDWKAAASGCDEVQAEIETPRGKLTLRRQVDRAQEPLGIYFGSMSAASESAMEGWERFPIRRQGGLESFSQVMFRSVMIPEARSEGASNITMHQVLRLCYSDQRTPATRLFRFEPFDTQNIRETVGDLICGVGGYEVFELGLELRTLQDQLNDVEGRLRSLHDALSGDHALDTPDLIRAEIENLKGESAGLQEQLDNVDSHVEAGQVKEYLSDRRKAQGQLISQKQKLGALEQKVGSVEFELREVREFVGLLDELREKVTFAEATFETVGSIEFTRCPACGEELTPYAPENHCIVCKSPLDSEREKSRYNQIRLDLEIQTRESGHLISQKEGELDADRKQLRGLRREHEKYLSSFDLKYSSGNGPREAFMAARISRLGHIEAEIDFLIRSLETAEKIVRALSEKAEIDEKIRVIEIKLIALRREAEERRPAALTRISQLGGDILRSDLPRQSEFMDASGLAINFVNDSMSVGGLVNFAESSNVILKNSAVFALFLAACSDEQFNHPRFLLIDNIEDKGMEEARSHLFQRIIVERATESKLPYQVIFTTSMMNPQLELEDYTIGPPYTNERRSLDLG